MRFFFSGPRIFANRTGVTLGGENVLGAPQRRATSSPVEGSLVYVLRGDHNMTKIGVSTNPNARLAPLRTASAFPVDFAFVGITPGTGYEIEKCAHAMLANHNGEWFDAAPHVAVAAVQGAAHALGQPIQPLKPESADQILRIGAAWDAADGNSQKASKWLGKAAQFPPPWRWLVAGLIWTVGIIGTSAASSSGSWFTFYALKAAPLLQVSEGDTCDNLIGTALRCSRR